MPSTIAWYVIIIIIIIYSYFTRVVPQTFVFLRDTLANHGFAYEIVRAKEQSEWQMEDYSICLTQEMIKKNSHIGMKQRGEQGRR